LIMYPICSKNYKLEALAWIKRNRKLSEDISTFKLKK
jgi:hypothetical protein